MTAFPALGLFRNGRLAVYPGAVEGDGAAEVLYWLSDTATLEVPGAVEKVGADILRNVIESEEDVLGDPLNEAELAERLVDLGRRCLWLRR